MPETLHHTPAEFEAGLHKVSDGIWAWLQPNGDFGEANAVLIASPSPSGSSVLIDTLYDQNQCHRMLREIEKSTDTAPIRYVVNTHNDGDHWWGNDELPPDVTIIATETAAHEMTRDPSPSLVARGLGVMAAAARLPGNTGRIATRMHQSIAPFRFDGVTRRYPDRTFNGNLSLDLDGRSVEFKEFRSAHTASDTIAYIPDAGVVAAGDLLFIGAIPVVWHGPISNWIDALDSILALDAHTYVPGHGPIATADDVRVLRDYLKWVNAVGRDIYKAHSRADIVDIAHDLLASLTDEPWKSWLGQERLVVNLASRLRELNGQGPIPNSAKTRYLYKLHKLGDRLDSGVGAINLMSQYD